MTIRDFFNDNPWVMWSLIALYAAECIAVGIIIFRIFKNDKKFKV